MTPEEHDATLTAYALNDASLTPAAREAVETRLATDAEARQAVEETRQLGLLLATSLAAESSAAPSERAVVIPSSKADRKPARWMRLAVAAALLLTVAGVSYKVWDRQHAMEEARVEARNRADYGDLALATESFNSSHGTKYVPEGLVIPDGTSNTVDVVKDEKADKGASDPKPTSPQPLEPTNGETKTMVAVSPASSPPGASPGKSPLSTGKRDPRDGSVPSPVIRPGLPAPGGAPAPDSLDEYGRPTSRGGYPAPRPGDDVANVESPPTPDHLVPSDPAPGEKVEPRAGDRHSRLIENSFVRVEGINALSTFGVDVDTASYAMVRKYLSMGQLPPVDAVRLEEMVNYFPYQDKAPDGDDPFAVAVEMADCPWAPAHKLVRLGLKAKPIAADKRPASNLVFLLDVSGSMNEPNKLPLVKSSLKVLLSQLGDKDRVAMVVYAGASGQVLESTPASKKEKIMDALDNLAAGGSTNGASGIQQAYDVAAAHFIKGGTNRVILCTDGDWNVGTTNTDALVKLIEQKRKTGVFLSVFGFGMGNLRDEMMVQLANKGNGNYGYIDTIKEANKAFVEQIGGTLITVAKDVKIQVEFNPAAVQAYRLLGYEKRALAAKDFHDDKKDAGEMGAGHVVTALYELVPTGAPDPIVGKVDGLRYQPKPAAKPVAKSDKVTEAFVVKMRHKKPDGDKSTLREVPVSNVSVGYEKASEDFQFAAAVASFAMLLRDSPYKGQSNYALVTELADAARKHDPNGYRSEFVGLVRKAKTLAGKP